MTHKELKYFFVLIIVTSIVLSTLAIYDRMVCEDQAGGLKKENPLVNDVPPDLRMMVWSWSPRVDEALDRALVEYEESRGVNIDLIRVLQLETYWDTLLENFTSETPPDVLWINHDMVLPLYQMEHIIELDTLLETRPEAIEGIPQEVIEQFRYEGLLYGIPLGAENEFALNAYAISTIARTITRADMAFDLITFLRTRIPPLAGIWNIQLYPPSPAVLFNNQRVDITFSYFNYDQAGVRIFVRPFTQGSLTPNYGAHGSPLYPYGEGEGEAYFTISSGEVTVDQLRFRVLNADQSILCLEFFIPVSYDFKPTPPTPTPTPTLTPTPTPTPTPPCGEDTLLWEDFDDGYAQGFGNETENWKVENGMYGHTGVSYQFSMAGDLSWQDYVIEADFINARDGGLLVRSQNHTEGIVLIVRPIYGDIYWHERENGSWGTIHNKNLNLGHEAGETLHVKVEVVGDEFKAYVNGTLKTTLNTDVTSKYPSGKIGVYLYRQQDQYWDNVSVCKIGAPTPTPTPTPTPLPTPTPTPTPTPSPSQTPTPIPTPTPTPTPIPTPTLTPIPTPTPQQPHQLWSRTWGGTEDDRGWGVAVGDGDSYMVGVTESFGAGENDAFLAKYDVDGNQVWNTTWGGTDDDYGQGVAVSGDVYIVGVTYSFGSGTDADAFLARYNADGNQLWNATWGGTGSSDDGTGLAVDVENIYITGYTGFGAGVQDAFLAKYDVDGNQMWNATWGGTEQDSGYGVAVDGNNVYIIGLTFSFGAGDMDAFLAKYDANGNQLWNKTWGGTENDRSRSVVVDDGIYITGDTYSFGTGENDAFLVKYDANGNQLWNTTWGGTNHELSLGLAVDKDIYVIGSTESFGAGNYDAFLAKFDVDGNQVWNTTWGGTSNDYGIRGAVDDVDVYITGWTRSFGAGLDDGFLIKYGFPPTPTPTPTPPPTPSPSPTPTHTPTPTPKPTPIPTPTLTPIPTPTPMPSPSSSPTPTHTPTPTPTPTPIPTSTPTLTPSPTPSPIPSPTPSPTPIVTPLPTPSPTPTPTLTPPPSPTPAPTPTPKSTPTPTPILTPTPSPTPSPTPKPTPSWFEEYGVWIALAVIIVIAAATYLLIRRKE